MINRIGIEKPKIKKMWFDETYGFSKLDSFNVYMRMLILNKVRIKTYLIIYFGITEKQIDMIASSELVEGKRSWLYDFKMKYYDGIDTDFGTQCLQKLDSRIEKRQVGEERTKDCTQIDLTFIQWGSRKLTKNVKKVNFQTFRI